MPSGIGRPATDQFNAGAQHPVVEYGVTDPPSAPRTQTVRDATLDVFRRLGLTTVFANPGATEVPLLAGLPEDIEFVLGLHEGSVVGIASGWALAQQAAALGHPHTPPRVGH